MVVHPNTCTEYSGFREVGEDSSYRHNVPCYIVQPALRSFGQCKLARQRYVEAKTLGNWDQMGGRRGDKDDGDGGNQPHRGCRLRPPLFIFHLQFDVVHPARVRCPLPVDTAVAVMLGSWRASCVI
jgi:hypothetical protein